MAIFDEKSHQSSLIPSFLYSSSTPMDSMGDPKSLFSSSLSSSLTTNGGVMTKSSTSSIMVEAPSEKMKMYSPSFYAACTAGGMLSCGLTHTAITPLDLVKCNIQIDPAKYKNISSGFGVLMREQGIKGLFKGWAPTFFGYSAQGAFKMGGYEFFKKYYADIAGPEYAAKYKSLIILAGSASAELIADVALCPFEAVKVRVQTQPGFARGLSDGLPKIVKSEGAMGLFKGQVPLWGHTMMKFASFETIVELMYKHAIPTPKDECSKTLQLGVSFAGGYVAGVFCAVVSHPADNLVSFLNNSKGASVADNSHQQSPLIPSFLYTSSFSSSSMINNPLHSNQTNSSMNLNKFSSSSSSACSSAESMRSIMVHSPNEKIKMYSPTFYAACTAGGIFSCGLTHMAVTPLDLVKCNMQIDPAKYKNITSGFGVLLKEQGIKGFFRGWVPTLFGYSAQGACKFGFYEFFKKYYSDIAGPEYAVKYKTLIYLAGSASAELIADVALCPLEAVKVRVQTQPGFARGFSDGFPKLLKLYKGLVPLWGRHIFVLSLADTMMKFASFEKIVELMYKYAIPTPKDQCSKSLQLGVSFAGGYVAGVFCAIVSHPADNMVSFLNNAKGASVGDAVKKFGLWGLFTRGLPLRIVMIGTLTGAQWGIYDAFKVFVGLPTSGGSAPATQATK
ncbi:Mitochondrial phosphate carrier protein 3 mitochondrial [Bienertia sinuspersici]